MNVSISELIYLSLMDKELIDFRDYPDAETCHDDVKKAIEHILQDYIIIKGEIMN